MKKTLIIPIVAILFLLICCKDVQPPVLPGQNGIDISIVNSSVGNFTLNLSVSSNSNAVAYQFQISSELNDFSSEKLLYDKTSEAYEPSIGLARFIEGSYYWRARGIGTDGNVGDWTEVRVINLLSPLSGMQPQDDGIISDVSSVLSWNALDGAVSYEVNIIEAEGDWDTSTTRVLASPEYVHIEDFSMNRTYFWRVRARNGEGKVTVWKERTFHLSWGSITGMFPADGGSSADTTPVLGWDSVSGADHYEIQVANSESDLDSAELINCGSNSYTPSSAFLNNNNYYWRVRAVDEEGQASLWSDVLSFGISWGSITGMVPGNGESTTDTTPTLSWDTVSGADHYELQIGENQAGLDSISPISLIEPEFTVPENFTKNMSYYWRARAIDADNQPTLWSNINELAIVWGPVIGLNPADGGSSSDLTPTFRWDGLEDSVSYEIQIVESETELDSVESVTVPVTEYTPTTTLSNNTSYFWRVRGIDGEGVVSLWSSTNEITMSWGHVTGMLPVEGAVLTDLKPTFSWETVIDADYYGIGISCTDSDFELIETTIYGTEFTPSNSLPNNETFFWFIIPCHMSGVVPPPLLINYKQFETNWGNITGMLPSDGAVIEDTKPTFNWNPVEDADHYEIQIVENVSDFDTASFTSVSNNSYIPEERLTNHISHYWRIRAVTEEGNVSFWSMISEVEISCDTIYLDFSPESSSTTIEVNSSDGDPLVLKTYLEDWATITLLQLGVPVISHAGGTHINIIAGSNDYEMLVEVDENLWGERSCSFSTQSVPGGEKVFVIQQE